MRNTYSERAWSSQNRGDFRTPIIISKTVTSVGHAVGPLAIRYNVQIGCRPKGYGGSAGTGSVPKEKGLDFENFL